MLSLQQLGEVLGHDLTKDQARAVVRVGLRLVFAGHILFACGWLAMFGLPGFAKASEIEGVKGQLANLSAQFEISKAKDEVGRLEQQLRSIDQEMFLIEAKLSEIGRLGQQADQLYTQRLSVLRTEKREAERRLERAMDHPSLRAPKDPPG